MTKDTLNICLAEVDLIWEDANANLKQLDGILDSCIADVIILPEMFPTGFTKNKLVAEKMNGDTISWMKDKAQQLECAICGSLSIEDEGNYYNRFIWVEPDRGVVTYDKRHLFTTSGEHDVYEKGNHLTIIEYKGWKISPFVCYDLRFPVWSRNVELCDLYIYVANWPAARNDVWQTLLKARAVENQIYVAGVNRLGTDGNNISYCGESSVAHPRGHFISCENEGGLKRFIIEKDQIYSYRKQISALDDIDEFEIFN